MGSLPPVPSFSSDDQGRLTGDLDLALGEPNIAQPPAPKREFPHLDVRLAVNDEPRHTMEHVALARGRCLA